MNLLWWSIFVISIKCSYWNGFQDMPTFALDRIKYRTVYPKKYAHGFCFAVLCCGYTLTDFPISIRLTSLALWQSNDCPSASKATQMNMDKYFMWIHYERLHYHNKAKHNKTMCIILGIYCTTWHHCGNYKTAETPPATTNKNAYARTSFPNASDFQLLWQMECWSIQFGTWI